MIFLNISPSVTDDQHGHIILIQDSVIIQVYTKISATSVMFKCNYSLCFILNVISQHVLFLLIYIFLSVKCFEFLQGSHD
jgi:hypothetical protein